MELILGEAVTLSGMSERTYRTSILHRLRTQSEESCEQHLYTEMYESFSSFLEKRGRAWLDLVTILEDSL